MEKPAKESELALKRSDKSETDSILKMVENWSTNFKGRRIVEIEWKGRKTEAVEGLFVYLQSGVDRVDRLASALFERLTGIQVTLLGQVDRFGMQVILVEGDSLIDSGFDFIEKLKPLLGNLVEWVEPVMIDRMAETPNDSGFAQQWGLETIKAERAWDLSKGHDGKVVLAVLDSGVPIQNGKLSHPDLSDPSRFLLGPDLINNSGLPTDDHGHGTHVLGTAAANRGNGRGIAGLWDGPVFVAKVFDKDVEGGTCVTFKDGVLSAIEFAKKRGAKLVINYSGVGADNKPKRAAIEEAMKNDVVIVAPAGNGNADKVDFPAAYSTEFPNVIGVAGINVLLNRAPNSNRGAGLTVAAPGLQILSTIPDYPVTLSLPTPAGTAVRDHLGFMSGTSMACSFVSGLAALVRSKFPNLTAKEVRDRIAAKSDLRPNQENEFGRGIINAEKALS